MGLDRYIEKGGKRLRYGYTTGSCAAAASKGAALMLLAQKDVDVIAIDTPKGWRLDLELFDRRFSKDDAVCSVIKDAGDDPDVTNGLRIFSKVAFKDEPGIDYRGGIGVGQVTLPGLSVPVGEPAINPVPRRMIEKELGEVSREYHYDGGWVVEVSIPGGDEIAKRTFNPKLGIVGGLSIVGTSGIVEPMSEDALLASMKLELSMLKNRGYDDVLFVPGNYGKDFCEETLKLSDERMFKTSNYVGLMLEEAERLSFNRILFVGHLGKLVKVAGGLFNTHSHVCDGRMEILAANAAWLGGSRELVDRIMKSPTTDEAAAAILDANIDGFFNHLAERAKMRCQEKVYHNIQIEVVIFSQKYGLLGKTEGADELMKVFRRQEDE